MEAAYYEATGGQRVRCTLCPHRCLLASEETGICGVRANHGGALFTENHEECVAVAVAPIEAIPFYHFHPGCRVLAVGGRGDALACPLIDAAADPAPDAPTRFFTARELAEMAMARGAAGVAFAYGEPLVWFEQLKETADEARNLGLHVSVATRAFVDAAPLAELLPRVDAWSVEIFGVTDEPYQRLARVSVAPVLAALRRMRAAAHVEVKLRIIPSFADGGDGAEEVARWIAAELGRDVPLLVAPYLPRDAGEEGATPVGAVLEARDEAESELPHCYAVQVAPGAAPTECSACGAVLVDRRGLGVRVRVRPDGSCPGCGRASPIVVGGGPGAAGIG